MTVPTKLEHISQVSYISLTKKIIFHDGSDSIFICPYTSDGSISFMKKRISFSKITNIFQLDKYIVIQTKRESEGFYIYDSIKESLDSIKCLLPQTNFQLQQVNKNDDKKVNAVFDFENQIIVRFQYFEIDAWNYSKETQLFYDDSSLKKYLDKQNTQLNEVLDMAIDNVRGIFVTIQLDKTIAVWDYWSGILITIYEEIEAPTKIFYQKTTKIFVISEQTKIVVLSIVKDANQDLSVFREELLKPFNIINIKLLVEPLNLFLLKIYKIDSLTSAKIDYLKFSQVEGQPLQKFINLDQGYQDNYYDQINKILILFYLSNIQIYQVEYLQIDSKMNINTQLLQTIQIAFKQQYQLHVNSNQKHIFIATSTRLLNYSYKYFNLTNHINYTKQHIQNVQLKQIEETNLIILYNKQFFQAIDTNSFQILKTYLNNFNSSILTVSIKSANILIALSDQRVIILDSSSLLQPIYDFSLSQQVSSFIDYEENNQLALLLFKDGTIGKLNTQAPFQIHHKIAILDNQIQGLSFFQMDNEQNTIYFSEYNQNQYQLSQISIDNLSLQHYIIKPLTWSKQEQAFLLFIQILNTPLQPNDQNQSKLLQCIAFQLRKNQNTNQNFIDMFLYDFNNSQVLKYKQGVHNSNVTIVSHGAIQIKAGSQQILIIITYCESENQIKLWNALTLDQINPTLYLKQKVDKFITEFNSAQIFFTLQKSLTIYVYSITQAKIIKEISSLISYCTSLIVNYQQNIFIVGEQAGRVQIFQQSSFLPIAILTQNSEITLLQTDQTQNYLIVGTSSNIVYVYKKQRNDNAFEDLLSYQLNYELQFLDQVTKVFIQNEFNIMFICQQGQVKAWNLDQGNLIGSALIDNQNTIVDQIFFSIYSRLLIICTKQSIITLNMFQFTNPDFMLKTMQMKKSIQQAVYFQANSLLVYSQIVSKKSVGTVEFWDSQIDKFKLIHQGFNCKPIQIINALEILVINCQNQLLAIQISDLQTKSVFQFKSFQIKNETIIQSKTNSNYLYGINRILNKINLYIVCLGQGNEINIKKFSSIQFQQNDIQKTQVQMQTIEDIFFLTQDFLLISYYSGQIIVVTSDLKQMSNINSQSHKSQIQGVKISISQNEKSIILFSFDRVGIISKFILEFDGQALANKQNENQLCFQDRESIQEYFSPQSNQNNCNSIQFSNIFNLNLTLLNQYADKSNIQAQPNDLIISQESGYIAFIIPRLQRLQFVDIQTMKHWKSILIPLSEFNSQLISCSKSNIILVLTDFQINIYQVQVNIQQPKNTLTIVQSYYLIDSQLGYFQKIIYLQNKVFLATCQKGYKIIQLVNSLNSKQRTFPNSNQLNIESKQITYLNFPVISNINVLVDNQGNQNIQIRGYHEKGLMMHIIPIDQGQEKICQHNILETDFLIIQKTLKFLETTYDTTVKNFDSFYIMISLNMKQKLKELPDLKFKYNSTLHLKGLSNQKKNIEIPFQNNKNHYIYDIGLWNQFIIENVVLLPQQNQIQQNKNYYLNITNNYGLNQNITFINLDFYYTTDPTQIGINPPMSNKYLQQPIHLNIKNISNVTFMNVNYKYQSLNNSSGIKIINSQYVNLLNFNIDSCFLNNSTLIKIYSETLLTNRAEISISQIQVTRSVLSQSKIFLIDNSNQLFIENLIIKYNQGILSKIFFLAGISNHQHCNTHFYMNSGISYLYQQSAILLNEMYSHEYQINNSSLSMKNISIYNNNITDNLMVTESGQTTLSQITIRNIQKTLLQQQIRFIQQNYYPKTSENQLNKYPFLYEDIQNVTLHFEYKPNLNTFLLSNFNQSQNSMSIPNILVEYDSQVKEYLLSQPDKINSLIILQQQSRLFVYKSFFENIKNFDHVIYGQNINANIDQSVYRNIISTNLKGIVFLSNSQLNITGSIFRDNQGYFCTGVYLQNSYISSQAMEIYQSSFHNNTAKLLGGAVCAINVVFDLKKNIFNQNYALVGGSIYYYYFQVSQFVKQNLVNKIIQQNNFLQNQCKIFGQNIGSRPIKIQTLQKQIQKQKQSEYYYSNVRSGQYADISFVLLDDENRKISIQDTPQAVFVLSLQNFQNVRLNDYSAIQLIHNQTLNESVFQFTNQIIGIPSKQSSLELNSASIPPPFNQSNEKETNMLQNNLKLNIYFRDCLQGEVYSQDTFKEYFTCRQCSDGLYSLIDPLSREKNNQKCMLCPPQASYCSFSQIYLNPGFWRLNNETDQILECVNNPSNCAGNDTCKEGHLGPLCEDCDIEGKIFNQKYSKLNMYNFDCMPCKNEIKQHILIAGIIIFMSFYLLWSVKQTIDRAKATIQVEVMRIIKMISLGRSSFISLTAAYIKIANDYFQIISGLKQVSVRYADFNLFVDFLGDSFSQTSFSLDCFLINNFEFLSLNYARIIWIHLNAIFYICIFAIVYKILVCFKLVQSKFYTWTNALILFSLFTQYSIMQILISSISCRQIGNKSFVKLYISMECWGKDHLDLFVSLILPLLLIQLFSLIFKLYLLISIRKKLNNFLNILRYGLLYLEYTPQNYFWEILKILKRILVTICINMFSQNNQIKGIMSTLVLLFYFILLNKMQPFRKTSLNNLEKYSTLVQLLLYFLAVLESQNDKYQNFFAYLICSINYLFISILVYKVIKKNKSFVKLKSLLNSCLQKKLPKVYSCFQKYFKSNQSQTRILWRNLAWVVGDFLKRRKKNKNACMFAPFNLGESTPIQKYKLKDMRSSQQISQLYAQNNLNTTESHQPQITKDILYQQSIFPEMIQNSTTLEMVSSIDKNTNLKKKSLLIQDSIIIDDGNNKSSNPILKRIQKSSNNSQVGGIQSLSLKKSIVLRNSLSQNGPLQQKQNKNQDKMIKLSKISNFEITSSVQQTTNESNFDKNTVETTSKNNINKNQSQQCIPSEYDDENDSIFVKYNTQYVQTIQNQEQKQCQIKKSD
ncbi:transmembrane protein, putative (macronuclear) [Tetrahymena thermophila SB210]|uniref:Transmembrane protein, putative n=1 Tax=Tetrahymena thermophila (strain SB210) TaxID=312017 RepID=I7MIZ5_TETTS|nr:transmembrane protein, putative [Tetrahymena thermophila SB210]EAS04869.2 transmembrane protein, putative [Tetrahymena thermophila SB210]|eukprot:XP_001025114.2 transmembrane protein, putative [Tetrahymena thermophila SB210]